MSKIEWTQKTWNPTLGCTEVSPGCTNCYAARMASRLSHIPAMKEDYAGLTKKLPNGKIVWTGLVKEMAARLFEPINSKKAKLWFVDSMSDLFHEDVSFDFIDNVFAVMDCCPQHTFQILTKRIDRAATYFAENRDWRVGDLKISYDSSDYDLSSWPLKNVWIGVSVEDQKTADARRENLLSISKMGWITWVSNEPALSKINWNGWEFIKWLVTGGESGFNARPMHPDIARGARDWCIKNGIPFFFKQWGEYASVSEVAGAGEHYTFPDGATVRKVGKKKAGNFLDGVHHLEYPQPIKI